MLCHGSRESGATSLSSVRLSFLICKMKITLLSSWKGVAGIKSFDRHSIQPRARHVVKARYTGTLAVVFLFLFSFLPAFLSNLSSLLSFLPFLSTGRARADVSSAQQERIFTLSTQILAMSTPLFSEGQIHSSQADGESPMHSQVCACLGCWTLQLHLGHSDILTR